MITDKPGGAVPSRFALKLGIILFLSAFAFSGAVLHMVRTWSYSNTYSHGFLVPLISLYFVWTKRRALRSLPFSPSRYAGFLAVAGSCLVLAAGHVSSLVVVQQVSIVLVIPSLVLMLMGWRHLKALALPLLYLVLMVPALDVLIERIQWPFQLLSAKMAVEFLQLFSVPVFLNRQFIELPSVTLEVAKACSGVQYLVAVIALAVPLAYVNHAGRMRAVLLGLAVAVGIITNWTRVILIALWSYMGGEVLHGPMHIFQGLFVAIAGFVILFAISLILARLQERSPATAPDVAEAFAAHPAHGGSSRFNAAAVAGALLLIATSAYIHLYRVAPVALAEPLRKIPFEIAGWRGADNGASIADLPFMMRGADSEIYRSYTGPSGAEVKVYVAYFESQSQGKELVRHDHARLFGSSHEVEIPYRGGSLRVNQAAYSGARDYLVLYWYNINGRSVSGRVQAKLSTLLDGVLRRRTNGAVIMVFWDAPDNGTGQDLLGERVGFINALLPEIESRVTTF